MTVVNTILTLTMTVTTRLELQKALKFGFNSEAHITAEEAVEDICSSWGKITLGQTSLIPPIRTRYDLRRLRTNLPPGERIKRRRYQCRLM